jgi:hypothetical protein
MATGFLISEDGSKLLVEPGSQLLVESEQAVSNWPFYRVGAGARPATTTRRRRPSTARFSTFTSTTATSFSRCCGRRSRLRAPRYAPRLPHLTLIQHSVRPER